MCIRDRYVVNRGQANVLYRNTDATVAARGLFVRPVDAGGRTHTGALMGAVVSLFEAGTATRVLGGGARAIDGGSGGFGAQNAYDPHFAVADLDAAVDGIEDLDEVVSLVFGDMPAGAAMQLISADNFIHCWDLARSTGQDFDPPVDLVEATTAFFGAFITDDSRAGGMFGPEVEVPDEASALDRLLGFCGRTP